MHHDAIEISGKQRSRPVTPVTPRHSRDSSQLGQHPTPSRNRPSAGRSPGRANSGSRSRESRRGAGHQARASVKISVSRPASSSGGGRRYSETRKPGDRPSWTPNGSRGYWRPADGSRSPGGTKLSRRGGFSRSHKCSNRPRSYWGRDPRKGYSPRVITRQGRSASPRVIDATASGGASRTPNGTKSATNSRQQASAPTGIIANAPMPYRRTEAFAQMVTGPNANRVLQAD